MYPADGDSGFCFLQCEIFSQFTVERKLARTRPLMQFESHSHRGFSPVISSVTKQETV
jgi:hypothetical protein